MPLRKRNSSKTLLEESRVPKVTNWPPPSKNSKLVLPRLVEDRIFHVHIKYDSRKTLLNIQESIKVQKHPEKSLWRDHLIEISGFLFGENNRAVGTPVVIGCRSEHVILQVSTSASTILSFLYVNLRSQHNQLIQDEVRYFPREVILRGNVQCLISPDGNYMVLSLPQEYMTENKHFKLLIAQIQCDGDDLQFDRIKDTRLSLKKHKLMAFDPQKAHDLVIVLVHSYCYKCRIDRWDLQEQVSMNEVFVKTNRGTNIPAAGNVQSGRNLLNRYQDETDTPLVHSQITYSKSGEHVIIHCLCTMQNGALQMRVIVLDSTSFEVTKNVWFYLGDTNQLLDNLFVSSTDDADDEIIISSQERSRPPQEIHRIKLPGDLSLQKSCRKVILRSCLSSDISNLQLPPKLINFLKFQSGK